MTGVLNILVDLEGTIFKQLTFVVDYLLKQSCITIESTRFLLISGYISGFSKAIEYFYVHHYSVMSQPSLPTKLLLTRAIIISKNDETTMIRSCTSCNVNIICVMYLVSSLIFFINSGEKKTRSSKCTSKKLK